MKGQTRTKAASVSAAPTAQAVSRRGTRRASRRAAAPASVEGADDSCDLETLWDRHGLHPDDSTRNALVEAYQGLVGEVVRRFASRLPRNVDRGDLLTAANVGLMAAVTSFDPARGVPFEAYGERRIKGALLDELRVQDWLPRPWRQRIEQHKRAVERLRAELGRAPRDEEVADALELPVADYQALFGTGFPGAPTGGYQGDETDDDPLGALGVVPDTRGDAPDVRLTREELLGLVAQKLTEQEYRIVYLKYWEELPMREIGQLTGLSESRVCKIHARLIDRLQERLGRHRAEGASE
jgi:RNA polymerase sigma factor for flagellar operon FliA